MNKFLRRLEMINTNVETARNDLSVINHKFIISFSRNKDAIAVSSKFRYRRCCVSVVMRPASYPISPHVAHGAIWIWDPCTNLRHQTQARFCNFWLFPCLVEEEEFCGCQLAVSFNACYSSSSRSSLICLAWEQYKLAQVLNSNLISEWLYWRKLKWKKSHLKIPIELCTIQTLTKQLHCLLT